jgi:hypothetical protein
MLDSSTLCHFAKAGAMAELHAYLGARARITREVERELLRLGARAEFSTLNDYLTKEGADARSVAKWPKTTKVLPDGLKAEFATLLGLQRRLGEHERAHSGEIATVLMARHRGTELVVMDDDWGAQLGRTTYALNVMSTARLVLEMVCVGAIPEQLGFQVFDLATPANVGRERFDTALDRLRRDHSEP